MKKSWYRRMLLSYFPIFLFTITMLTFLSFLMVNEISHNETVKADRISTGYIMDTLSRSLKGIETDVLEEVEKNDQYRNFLNIERTTSNHEVIFEVVDSMRGLIANDSLIDSMYVYRIEDKQVLTLSGLVPWDDFADREFLEDALANVSYQGWSPIRPYHELSMENDKKVISMYKREPLPFGTEGLVVINVDMYAVERMIQSMKNDSVTFLHIRDKAGQMLFSTMNAEEEDGKVLNKVELEMLGWNFESGIAAGQLFLWVSVISYVWVVIGVLTVVFAIVYILYITRKNYKPIRVMMNRIESIQLRNDGLGLKMDELTLIDRTLENLIQQKDDYEKEQNDHLLAGRKQLFYDLVQGEESANVEDRLLKLKLLSAGIKLEQFAFIMVEIGHYGNFRSGFSERDQHTLKFALSNVLQELARDEGMFAWAEWIGESRMGIIIGTVKDMQAAKEYIRQFAEKGGEWVSENLRISLLFGIGPVLKGWATIGISYKSAVNAMLHKLSLSKEAVIMSDDLPRNAGKKSYKYIQQAADLVREFRLSTGQWREHLEQIFESLEADCLKDEDIRMLLQTMMDMLGSELGSISEELQAYFKGEKAEQWKQTVDDTQSLTDLRSLFLAYLTEMYHHYVAFCETKNHHAMITEMKAYIEENFANPDLSLKHLSDRFHISAKYASYLFKEEFNMKFVDFIVQLRMEHAEGLLAETEDSVQSIALQVGYANSITFGRVFKRVIGVTPGDYRRLKLKPGKPNQTGTF
ncbi:AraC family transcriptional regulator [Paenibacillus sp. LHD-38]|uniref:helix-turn-helix domain-containing protein n=1 Tax=Paenibacillus sp. LHD-38 TaxID=3072143 RepID=UPI00280F16F8|nr:AraC family transcriptional regulator [Paenibacillus sp. LHD-38]MDQ8733544.1 AraC family transcriptional regulator [Paenibacillus sp. LHD-38]